ncbi:RicAFT regulatory complex protein RicA family protein [Priestia filamentosa]|uniref:RicAFT regulatory complex protein RicA family protein n=1 Tax=Priestia filamentosa TaxID=1402861 RepID=UPI0002DB5A0F|nr:RicAFT regulatory complex protein RicA family protein [Priestia filamentosa]
MKKYSKEDILLRARELAGMISETEEVDFFKRAEAKLNENEKVRLTINEIKQLQKQAVNFQHYGKTEALRKTEAKIDALQEELDNLPIIQQFKDSQGDINDLLQLVATTISKKVTDEIIISTDGNLLSGETGSQVKSSKGTCH